MDAPTISDDIKDYVTKKIADAMNFGTTKYGDTPTDALQLSPKQYVDAGVATAIAAAADAKRLVLVALADVATPPLNAAAGDLFTLDATGDRTIAVPTSVSSGKKIIIQHTAVGGNRTLALNTGGFRFGSIITGLTITVSGKIDYIGCLWNDGDAIFDVVAYDKGH